MPPRTTTTIRVDADRPDRSLIRRAAEQIRAGGLVAFPTETVYGLGANALDADAVAGIFTAKGRPPANPIIVHVRDSSAARELVTTWPQIAERLATRFWPGPLTLILPRKPILPDIVTAGGRTVGIRAPANAVAQALLEEAGVPIAAPSANRSSNISPTTAEHVLRSLDGGIDLILDGGPTSGGLESTVLDLAASPPRILRPGLVTAETISRFLDTPITTTASAAPEEILRSPGLLERHYAPAATLECTTGDGRARVEQLLQSGASIGWMPIGHPDAAPAGVITIAMPEDPVAYATRLYAALHELDAAHVERIVVAWPPDSPEWSAIRDRLTRAAAPR